MSENSAEFETYTGPIPEGIAELLAARDTAPLPDGALVRVQVISRGPSGRHNYRWLLYADGRLFLARNSPDEWVRGTLFNADFSETPTARLDEAAVTEMEQQLEGAGFLKQPPYQAAPGVSNGSYMVVTARLGDREYEVVYNAMHSALVTYLTYFPGRHVP